MSDKQNIETTINKIIDEPLIYRKALSKVDWRIVIPYSLAYICTNINKSNISNVAIVNLEDGHGIKKQLGLSSAEWAWCLTSFYYPFLFCEPLFTLLLKKFTPRAWMSRIMLTWGVISMLQLTAESFSGLVAARFFLGLAESSFYTSVLYHFSFWVKPTDLPSRLGFFYSCGMVSGAFSGLLAYGISHMDGKGGLFGYQWVFIFEGIPTVLIGLGYMTFFLPNYIETSLFLTEDEKSVLKGKLPSSAPKKADKTFSKTDMKALIKQPTFYTYSFIWLFQGLGGWGISHVLPTVIYELGFTDTAKTQLMSMPASLTGFVLLNLMANLIQRRIVRAFPVATTLLFLQIVCYIVLLTSKNALSKYFMLIFATAISNSLYPILWPDRIRVAKGASAGTGFAIGFTNALTTLSGIVGGFIYQSKFGPVYRVSYLVSILFCALSFINIVLTWWLVKREGLLNTEGAYAEGTELNSIEPPSQIVAVTK